MNQTLESSNIEEQPAPPQEISPEQKRAMLVAAIGFIILLIAVIGSLYYLLNQPPAQVALIRDVMIIFMALQSLLLGLVLVILIIQLARLINLLQNELRPIIDSMNETISNLRGTTVFLSENVTEPVIKLNEYLAGLSQFWSAIGLVRKSSKKRISSGE